MQPNSGLSSTLPGSLQEAAGRLLQASRVEEIVAAALEPLMHLLPEAEITVTVAGQPDVTSRSIRPRLTLHTVGGPLDATRPDAPTRRVVPLAVGSHVLGEVVVVCPEDRSVAAPERELLDVLAAQCALALDRSRLQTRLAQQEEEQRRQHSAMRAFIAFTEAVGSSTEVRVLIRQAELVLRFSIPGLISAYFEQFRGQWVATVATDERPEPLRALIEEGLPPDTPSFAEAVRTGAPVFIDGWNASDQRVPHT